MSAPTDLKQVEIKPGDSVFLEYEGIKQNFPWIAEIQDKLRGWFDSAYVTIFNTGKFIGDSQVWKMTVELVRYDPTKPLQDSLNSVTLYDVVDWCGSAIRAMGINLDLVGIKSDGKPVSNAVGDFFGDVSTAIGWNLTKAIWPILLLLLLILGVKKL